MVIASQLRSGTADQVSGSELQSDGGGISSGSGPNGAARRMPAACRTWTPTRCGSISFRADIKPETDLLAATEPGVPDSGADQSCFMDPC